jgi:hypothetical protein
MRTVDDLRAALADARTPAGVDVDAVRGRARKGRRRRATLAVAGTAVAVAAAIAVPAMVNGRPSSAPAATPRIDGCPNAYPAVLGNSGAGLDESFVPFPVTGMLLCQFRSPTVNGPLPLFVSRVVPPADARELVAGMTTARPPAKVCTDEYIWPAILVVSGHGRSVLLDVQASGCTRVTNGVLTGALDKRGFLQIEQSAPARLRCPARFEDAVPEPRGASKRLVSVRADLLRICEYTWGGTLVLGGEREFDGAGARDVVRGWEAMPRGAHSCPPALARERILVLVRGEGRTVRLGGTKDACNILANGSVMIQDVDWSKLLAPRK